MRSIYHFFLYLSKPISVNKERARREFILHILLFGLLVLTGIALSINLIDPLIHYSKASTESPLITGCIFLFFLFLFRLSKTGRSLLAATGFCIFLFIICVYSNYQWGPDLPVNLLLYALLIVISGILINTKVAFITTLACSINILFFSYLAVHPAYHPYRAWKLAIAVRPTDITVYIIILNLIALVSWLSNREIERALKRAKQSESALRHERDILEIKVQKRTQQLQQAQLEKITQMYRFVEFGKISSGLFHDLLNPLNVVSLNLETMQYRSREQHMESVASIKENIRRAMHGTKKLETFINAARKQLQYSTEKKVFSINKEITEVIELLTYRSHSLHISITADMQKNIHTYGNPIKFHQVVTNVLNNAIDAFSAVTKKETFIITISLQKKGTNMILRIHDNGKGIPKKYIEKIFDPFFTTKHTRTNIGFGLSATKDIIEKDFKGSVTVDSEEQHGTTFIISFPIQTHTANS